MQRSACTKDSPVRSQQRKRRLNDNGSNHNRNHKTSGRYCSRFLVVNKNGVLTVKSNMTQYFVIAGALLFLAVHFFLFRQLLIFFEKDPEQDHRIMSPSQQVQQQLPLPHRRLTPLRRIDKEKFTIRINTWQRLDQLLVSIDHHASCPGVAQIQVVWCEPIDPPAALLALHPDKVLIERHTVNSLNERFHILPTTETPTLGILSMDDDVLRPCDAIDSGFFQWTQSPERFVGFDYRIHVEQDDGSWKYGYLSTTQKANRYSMSLPRYAFLHRDYLDWYMTDLPRPIFDHVGEHFNCEDIAMSFFISSLTEGLPPLLAHFWAIDSMVKLYSPKKISGTKDHKHLRDECVESFAQQLNLKDRLQVASVLHRNDTMFYCGDEHYILDESPLLDNNNLRGDNAPMPERWTLHTDMVNRWRQLGPKDLHRQLDKMKKETSKKPNLAGLIEHSDAWEKKYNIK